MSLITSTTDLPILHKHPTKTPSFMLSKPFRLKLRAHPVTSCSLTTPSRQESLDEATQAVGGWDVKFRTLEGCKLGISRFPDFEYNAQGGVGVGSGRRDAGAPTDEVISVSFDVETLYIPPLTGATTRFLGLPLPPFLKIDIVPEIFQGNIDRESGKVDVQFRAKFLFSVGSIYRAPPLVVETTITTEESKGKKRRGRGERMEQEGRCRLVGVATVQPINDILMNSFLGLPTECIADLNAIISITRSA